MPWYYQHGEGEIVGPVSLEALRELAQRGDVDGNTQVGFADNEDQPTEWQLAHFVSDLELPRSSIPKVPRPPQLPSQRISQDDPLLQGSVRQQQQPISVPQSAGVGVLPILALVAGIIAFLVGGVAMAFELLTSLETVGVDGIFVWMSQYSVVVVFAGILMVIIGLLCELVRVNRALLVAARRQLASHEQSAVGNAPVQVQQKQSQNQFPPPGKKHPLD
ncbi:MAG: GYF domain-containing protein [Pirellulales bacterium]|nr:GYF domain-containing protein [Pirellulales bacterium]